ncbi:MAG: hypothetical protein AAGE52_10005 [Myxococcota bacterium]
MAPLITAWGVGLVLALLGHALFRLTPLALEPWERGMTTTQQIVFVAWALFMAYAEGYRGFQKKFSPRVVARAFYLGENPTPLRVLLALPFCMSLFHTTKRQRIVSWGFIVALVGVIIAVRFLPQPWRGIVDGGVVVGLGWGAISIVLFYLRGLSGNPPPVPDLPESAGVETSSALGEPG